MADTTWTGPNGGSWFTNTNWNSTAVPDSSTPVTLDSAATPVVTSAGAASAALTIGNTATGSLSISNGGTLTASDVVILGSAAGSTGILSVDGSGSNLTSEATGPARSGYLYVGDNGTGTLNITNGGSVNIGTFFYAGNGQTGVGNINVRGSGSALDINVFSNIGFDGSATLSITDGGTVTANSLFYLAENAGSSGTIDVSGSNSVLEISAPAYFGYDGNASVSITDGGTITTHSLLYLGANAGSSGTITINGAGSTLNTDTNLYVGNDGAGSLSISNGGSLNANNLIYIGYGADEGSSLSISGAGSRLQSSSLIYIGYNNAGSMTVSDGAAVSVRWLSVASQADTSGTLSITGTGTTFAVTGGNFNIGEDGTGHLTVSDGAALFIQDWSCIGCSTGAVGSALITGAGTTWTMGDRISVADYGQGSLTIADGATVTTTGEVMIAESNASAQGTATVTGAHSSWTVTDSGILVGGSGTGTLAVSDGGAVHITQSGEMLLIGSYSDSDPASSVIVTGATSQITVNGALWVENAISRLIISDGGAVSNTQAGGGTVTVTGAGSLWTNTGNLFIDNSLTLSNGGHVVGEAYNFIAGSSGETASALVTGAGSLWETGDILFVGEIGIGTLTLANSGVVQAQAAVSIADQAGSVGTLNIGAAAGDAATTPGTLEAATVSFGAGTGAIVFNHTSNAYTFSPAISGAGSLSFLSGKTILTGDSSGFTGTANVAGGILAVNGTLGGTVDVLSGGRLQGNGTIDDTTIATGGTIAPGNSIGTLHVAGALTLAAGSTFEVELNPTGQSDQIIATGAASLGGTLSLLPATGVYRVGTAYAILSAAGGLTGSFDTVSSTTSWLFLAPVVSYGANDVTVSIDRNATSFASVANTPNQRATATALDTLSAGNPLYDAIVAQTEAPTARGAFQDLSGDLHPSIKGTLLQNESLLSDGVMDHMAQQQADAQDPNTKTNSAPAATPRPSRSYNLTAVRNRILYGGARRYTRGSRHTTPQPVAPQPVPTTVTRYDPVVWGQGFGDWGQRSGHGNAASFQHNLGGIMAGADASLGHNWRAGFAFAYGSANYDQANHAKGSSNDASVLLYASKQSGHLGLRMGTSFGWHDIATRRTLSFPGFADKLRASYNAQTAQAFAETSYSFKIKQTTLSPFANGAFGFAHVPSFSEQGGQAALSAHDSSSVIGTTVIGLRARQVLSFFDTAQIKNRATLHGLLGWKHTLGDITPDETFRFAGSAPFSISGAPLATNMLIANVGFNFTLIDNGTLGLFYTTQMARLAADQAVRGTFQYAF